MHMSRRAYIVSSNIGLIKLNDVVKYSLGLNVDVLFKVLNTFLPNTKTSFQSPCNPCACSAFSSRDQSRVFIFILGGICS